MKKGLMITMIVIQLLVALLNSGTTRSLAELTAFLLVMVLFLDRPRQTSHSVNPS